MTTSRSEPMPPSAVLARARAAARVVRRAGGRVVHSIQRAQQVAGVEVRRGVWRARDARPGSGAASPGVGLEALLAIGELAGVTVEGAARRALAWPALRYEGLLDGWDGSANPAYLDPGSSFSSEYARGFCTGAVIRGIIVP